MNAQQKNNIIQSVSFFVDDNLSREEKGMIDTCLANVCDLRVKKDILIHSLVPVVYLMRSQSFHQRSDLPLAKSILLGDNYNSLFYHYLIQHHSIKTLKRLLTLLKENYLTHVSGVPVQFNYVDCFSILLEDALHTHLPKTNSNKEVTQVYDTLDTYKEDVENKMIAQFLMFDHQYNHSIKNFITSGGKKTRLTLFFHALAKGQPFKVNVGEIGLVIEGIHFASLIHDDIVDDANMRRHQPTLHTQYGVKTALYLGNAIFTQSLLILADIEDREVHRVFSRLFHRMVLGELTQQRYRFTTDLSVYRYLKLIRDKTALFVESIFYLAGYLSRQSIDTNNRLKRIGFSIGMAYQLKDDLLDYTADEQTLGKPVAQDSRSGYHTLVYGNDGQNRVRHLAHRYIERALNEIKRLPESIDKKSLIYYTTTLYKRTR